MRIKGFRKDNPESRIPEPGQYGKDVNGEWFGRAPRGEFHANLSRHEVVEHADGTITVEPSILVGPIKLTGAEGEQWHGFLRAGEWEEC